MIYKGNKEIIALNRDKKIYVAIYHGARLVWQAIRSCFGAGFWNNDKPWSNDETWNNG